MSTVDCRLSTPAVSVTMSCQMPMDVSIRVPLVQLSRHVGVSIPLFSTRFNGRLCLSKILLCGTMTADVRRKCWRLGQCLAGVRRVLAPGSWLRSPLELSLALALSIDRTTKEVNRQRTWPRVADHGYALLIFGEEPLKQEMPESLSIPLPSSQSL